MNTKLISDIETSVSALKAEIEQLASEKAMWEARAHAAEQLMETIDTLKMSKSVAVAAERAGVPAVQWMIDRISDACEPKMSLPVNPQVYERFGKLANAKGLTVGEMTSSVNMTRAFNELFENMRV